MEKAAFVCLLLTAAAAAAADDRGVGYACRVKGGAEGTCLPFADCPAAREALREGVPATACFFQAVAPIVCCPAPGPSTPAPAPTPTTSPPPPPSPKPSPSPAQQQSVASRMCSVYGHAVFRVEHTGGSAGAAQKVDQCAMRNDNFASRKEVLKDEFPHMALLGYGEAEQPKWLCGGSLISERFVLTALQCIITDLGPPRIVRLGKLDLKGANASTHEHIAVAEGIPHPDYKDGVSYNDVGLLRLARDVVFTSSIRPACLHARKEIEQQTVIATGWGLLDRDQKDNTRKVMKVRLPIVESEVCKKAYQAHENTSLLKKGFDEVSMVCAGSAENTKDNCQIASGDPLQVKLETPYCMYSLVGITSLGKGLCDSSRSPTINTRVSHFVPWIESVVWPRKS